LVNRRELQHKLVSFVDMVKVSNYVLLLLTSILVALFISTKIYLLIGLFLGLTWFPARLLLFKEDRLILRETFETYFVGVETETINKSAAFVIVFVLTLILNFLVTFLFWPGMALLNLVGVLKS